LIEEVLWKIGLHIRISKSEKLTCEDRIEHYLLFFGDFSFSN